MSNEQATPPQETVVEAPPIKVNVGGFNLRGTYKIPINVEATNPATGEREQYKLFHILRPFDDETFGWHANAVTAAKKSETPEVAWIELIREVWLRLVDSVEGYMGIETGAPLTDEQKKAIPYKHVEAAYARLIIEERVVPGEPQKN